MAKFRSRFTEEANEYLRENGWDYTSRELAGKMYDLFGITVATQTVTDQLRRLGIHRGARYHPAGYVNPCCYPVGTERVDKGRNVMVKVAQPNVWKAKAQVVMGYDPREQQAIFLDGNSLNVVPENIVVASKKVHARLAKNGWLNSNGEIIKAGVKWGELYYILREMEEQK